MADQKISQLTSASTPLAGTEVLPIVQSGATVKVSVENVVKAIQPGSTANTIPYLNASKTPTNGTALQFNGKVIGMSITPSAWASNYTGLQGQEGYAAVVSDNGNGIAELVSNAYNDGSWKYVNSSIGAVRVQGNAVSKTWALYTAPAGTAGGAISWTQRFTVSDTAVTVNADNIAFGTAAKGINFTANTPAAGMTSQLLNWYEEGTWTPNQGGGLAVVGAFSSDGTYTRIGRQVFIQGSVSGATSVAVASAGAITTNLPYSAAADATGTAINAANNASSILRVSSATLTAATAIAATTTITFSAVYSV